MICVHLCILYLQSATLTLTYLLRLLKWAQTSRHMERKEGKSADSCVYAFVYSDVQRRRQSVHLSQKELCLFLKWCDQSSCHLLSLDCIRSLPVAQSQPLLVTHVGSWHWNFNKLPEQLNLTLMCPLTGTRLPASGALTPSRFNQVLC